MAGARAAGLFTARAAFFGAAALFFAAGALFFAVRARRAVVVAIVHSPFAPYDPRSTRACQGNTRRRFGLTAHRLCRIMTANFRLGGKLDEIRRRLSGVAVTTLARGGTRGRVHAAVHPAHAAGGGRPAP